MSPRSNIAMLFAATIVSVGAFWAVASAAGTQEELFGSDLPMGNLQPVACPSEPMNVLLGQPVAEVDLDTLPRPYELYAHDGEPRGEYQAQRLLIRFDANGTVTNVDCG
ncbi:hypothetical protein [Hyphobacterium sp.]|uniref:hypothetical protein n=1 Tax=Hyphobacterium sp. TaxID=2004662 RepID=UPI003B51AC16